MECKLKKGDLTMKDLKNFRMYFFLFSIVFAFLPSLVSAGEIPDPKTYIPSTSEIEKHKKPFDDPRPYLKEFGPKQVLPKDLYAKLSFDEEKMKSLWSEIVGFRAPDVVGKIAPEIKPGKYTYKDLEKYPGFKQLIHPEIYNRIKPGAPPYAGNFSEFEIIPTRQYYWALPISEGTKKNMGKTKLDKKGYMIPETWEGGIPFPRPSGEFKAQEIMYSIEKRYTQYGGDFYMLGYFLAFSKNLKQDFNGLAEVRHLNLAGRLLIPPYGFFDERAKKAGEFNAFVTNFLAPRDTSGLAQSAIYYLDPQKFDQLMVYVPSLRRVRKMTATDSQDPIMGIDVIYDDNEGWYQKLSPTRYPYKFEVIEEREYLVRAPSIDGAEYIDSKTTELKNVRMERRPIYVIKLKQLDTNYVYSERIFFIDKETFVYYLVLNYDQKGRLYRSTEQNWGWNPEMGMISWSGNTLSARDHVDHHSTLLSYYVIPAYYSRGEVSIEGFIKAK
jgi:hypothetical protein